MQSPATDQARSARNDQQRTQTRLASKAAKRFGRCAAEGVKGSPYDQVGFNQIAAQRPYRLAVLLAGRVWSRE
jgi:hypothetical protein